MQHNFTRTAALALFLIALAWGLSTSLLTHATLYQPGETLNPDCAPGTPHCGVVTTASSMTFTASGAGAVSRTVQDKLNDIINAKDFGCVGDDATDNTTCLANLRSFLIAHDGSTVVFPDGTYRYTNNAWLRGVKNVRIVGHGHVGFRNVASWTYDFTSVALAINADYFGDGITVSLGSYQSTIASASAGATTITTTAPSAAAAFAPGNYVFIGGYGQQLGGYPPNLRYFEINRIQSVDSTTGTLTLETPLRNSYDSRWYAQAYSGVPYGPPVVVNLNRTGTYAYDLAEHIVIDGITFKANPNGPSYYNDFARDLGSVIPAGVLNLEVRNIRAKNFSPTMGGRVTITDSDIAFTEPDKLLDTVVIERSRIGTLTQASGVNTLIVRDSDITGYFNSSARNTVVENNKIYGGSPGGYGAMIAAGAGGVEQTPVYRFTARDNVFYENPGQMLPLINPQGVQRTMTALTAPTSASFTTDIDWNTMTSLDIGSTIRSVSGKTGTVTAIYYNGTNLTIEGTFSSAPTAGDVFTFYNVRQVSTAGNTVANLSAGSVRQLYTTGGLTGTAEWPFYISSDENIGIATTTPRSKLVVQDSSANLLSLWNGTEEKMTVLNNGNVGIGTSTPGSNLTVAGDINFTGTLYHNGVAFVGSSQWTTSGSNIYYNTGNVGIGTLSPNSLLTIAGSADLFSLRSTAGVQYADWTINTGAVTSQLAVNNVTISNSFAGSPSSMLAFNGNNVTLGSFGTVTIGGGASNSAINLTTGSGDITFLTNAGINRMVIKQGTGNVGIGTTSPVSKLDVWGNLNVATGSNPTLFVNTASGSVGIGTSTPTVGPLVMGSGAYVTAGGVWTNASDRSLKENFATVTAASVLEKIDSLPVMRWNYKAEDPSITHIGPVAQDFYAAFGLGGAAGKTSISTIDPAGVALLGIQALDQKLASLQGSLIGNLTATSLSVYVPGRFSGDSVGEATILAGQTTVRVTFKQPYTHKPIVTITPEELPVTGGYVTGRDASGFTIRIPTATTSDVTFAWHSFASPEEQLTVSDGTTLPITLVVATSSSTRSSPVISVVSPNSIPEADSDSTSTPTPASATSTPSAEGTTVATSTPASSPLATGTTTPPLDSSPTSTPSVPATSSPSGMSTASIPLTP